jgi:hypothetical protein
MTLVQVWNHGSPHIPLYRGSSFALRQEKTVILDILHNLNFQPDIADTVLWGLYPFGIFIVHFRKIF